MSLDKVVAGPEAAVADIPSGASLAVGGFGLSGIPWTLIEAGVVEGRRLTSYPSLKTDLKNAGAQWVDEEVVVDNGLTTSRSPEDLDAFNAKVVEELSEGKHEDQTA